MGIDDAAVDVQVDGIRLLGTAAHRSYLERVRLKQREAFMAELLRDTVRPGAIVVDVGAFLGHFALIGARQAGDTGRVIAFEPDPRDFPWLVRNIALNGFGHRITAVDKAASDRAGEMAFFLAHADSSESSLYPASDGGERIAAECTTVDDELGDRPVDVIKIDVEGAELRTLAGMERTLAASASAVLFIEWNPRALQRAGHEADVLIGRLHELGFEPQLIDEERHALAPVGPAPENYANLYCTRR